MHAFGASTHWLGIRNGILAVRHTLRGKTLSKLLASLINLENACKQNPIHVQDELYSNTYYYVLYYNGCLLLKLLQVFEVNFF